MGMRAIVFPLLSLAVMPVAVAQYRCVENGKTVITDRPCASNTSSSTLPAGNASKLVGDVGNSAYSTSYGDWRGQVQYQATYRGQSVAEAHAVVPTTISIDPQGKVVGVSPETGCRIKGVAIPGTMPTLLSLDVTLTSCRFAKFNRRLSGSLSLYPVQKHAQFWIYAFPVDFLDPGWSFDIKGTLRR